MLCTVLSIPASGMRGKDCMMNQVLSKNVSAAPVAQMSYPSPLREFLSSFSNNKGALAGFCFLVLMVLAAVLAPWLAPHDPLMQFRDHMLQPPAWQDGGSMSYLLGTDEAGRDILSRLMHGARLSLVIGFSAVIITLVPGILLGLAAAFFPNTAGRLLM